MTIEVQDEKYNYTIITNCGQPEHIVRCRLGAKTCEEVEWDQLPFLTQQRVEATINEALDGCPPGLWNRSML